MTTAVDVQAEGFWYEIRAWAFGPDGTSWQVAEGYLNDWSGVEEVIFESTYADAEGKPYPILMTLIDSGDGKRTGEIYEWCRLHRGCYPSKGFQRRPRPWSTTRLDAYPNGKAIPGGLHLYTIDTTHYKDRLASRLEISPQDPGAWHLNSDTTDNYARHMCAEFRDEHGVWQNPSGKRNDLWDCGVLHLALFDILRIGLLPDPNKNKSHTPQPKTQRKDWRQRPSWRR